MKKVNVRFVLVFLTLASSMALAAGQLQTSDPNLSDEPADESAYVDPVSRLTQFGGELSRKVMGPTPKNKPQLEPYRQKREATSIDLFDETKFAPGDDRAAVPPADATGVGGAN